MDRQRVAKAWSVAGTWNLLDKSSVPTSPPSQLENSRNLIKSFAKSAPATVTAALPGLGLTLVGMKMATAESLDSLPCTLNCFSDGETRSPTMAREQPVTEQIELQREGRSLFLIRNRTDEEKRTLEFSDLKVRIHSLFD